MVEGLVDGLFDGTSDEVDGRGEGTKWRGFVCWMSVNWEAGGGFSTCIKQGEVGMRTFHLLELHLQRRRVLALHHRGGTLCAI